MALTVLPAATCGHVLVAYAVVSIKYGRPKLGVSWSYVTQTLREAVPYALFVLLRQLSTRMDVVLLGFFLGAAASGVFNVAYRLIFLLLFLPYFAGLSLFPSASRLYTNSPTELKALYHKSLSLIVLFAVPTASGLWLVAPDLVILIFGETFTESALILRYLSWLILLAFVKSIMGIFLTSCDRQVDRTRGQWTAAWVNVLGNLILIPTIGIKGAAVATLISETLLVIIFATRLRAFFGWPRIASRLAMSGAAAMTFCALFTFVAPVAIGVVIPVSVLLYLGSLALFKDIRKNEIRTLIRLLQGESVSLVPTGQNPS
jgi:O-antigen/teichoic acid export membrane protein